MPRQIQSSVIQQPTDQGGGNPFLDLIGAFLPMAFGMPPLPGAGKMLSGLFGQSNPFMPQGINPYAKDLPQGAPAPSPLDDSDTATEWMDQQRRYDEGASQWRQNTPGVQWNPNYGFNVDPSPKRY